MMLRKRIVERITAKGRVHQALRIDVDRKPALVVALIVISAQEHKELIEFTQNAKAGTDVVIGGKIKALAETQSVFGAQVVRHGKRRDVRIKQLNITSADKVCD